MQLLWQKKVARPLKLRMRALASRIWTESSCSRVHIIQGRRSRLFALSSARTYGVRSLFVSAFRSSQDRVESRGEHWWICDSTAGKITSGKVRENVAVHVDRRLHAHLGVAVQVSHPAAQEETGQVYVPAYQPPGRWVESSSTTTFPPPPSLFTSLIGSANSIYDSRSLLR